MRSQAYCPDRPHLTTGETRIDAKGMTALPGFIDAHVHIGNPLQGLAGAITPPEYVFKLWLAHGITTVRDVGSVMGLDWTVQQARPLLASVEGVQEEQLTIQGRD